jgi:hypothetical protein
VVAKYWFGIFFGKLCGWWLRTALQAASASRCTASALREIDDGWNTLVSLQLRYGAHTSSIACAQLFRSR